MLGGTVQSADQVPAKRPAAATTRDVRVNRTVPRVSPPALTPVFSEEPTDADLRRARVFAEPLLPLGPTSSAENEALAAAIVRYTRAAQPLDVQPFVEFLNAHASSAWRASLQANLGGLHRGAGYHSRALKAWDEAWAASQNDRSPQGRAIADMAAAGALDMLATMGQVAGLDRWLQRIEGRAMTGPAAMRAARAREVRALVVGHPERSIASGPKALEILLAWQSKAKPDASALVATPLPSYRQTAAGTTLAELQALASKAGLPMTAVRREAGAPLVTPAIVHLGIDHFSAVLEARNGRYRVRDPALGGELWMPRAALDEEMTGAALIPAAQEAPGWRALSSSEAAEVVGHSCPAGLPDPDECPCEDSEPGMPTYSLHQVQASVMLADAPLGYTPPRGPSVNLQLRYNHREENQPQVFTFANLGAKWTANWLAYLEEVPWQFFIEGGVLKYAEPEHVAVHVPQGGVERFVYPDTNGVYPRHYRSGAVLALVSSDPIRYERRHTDGSREIYDVSDGGVPGQRRVFVSAIVDPHGQTLQFTWDAQLRLVALTDALGQVTTLQYDDPDPLKVTSVTDPFGRVARFAYDGEGHLASVTDVITLTSTFRYGQADFISTLETPYGVTAFRAPSLSGQNARAVEAVDPLGAVERVEFWYTNGPVPATAPAGREDGEAVSEKRVRRLMRDEQIRGRSPKRFKQTTHSDHTDPIAANVLARDFTAAAPNQRWVSDTTEFVIGESAKLYLAAILDLYSRLVVGWAISAVNDGRLTLTALEMAVQRRCPDPGLLHHSDRGCTYTCEDYQTYLAVRGITCSMSRRGDCFDNAVIESFFATVKKEEAERFPSYRDAKMALFDYIEVFYNQRRRHSTLGQISPATFERAAAAEGMDAAIPVDAKTAPTGLWKTAQNAVSHSVHTHHPCL